MSRSVAERLLKSIRQKKEDEENLIAIFADYIEACELVAEVEAGQNRVQIYSRLTDRLVQIFKDRA
jgi:hypothetical protein